MAMFVKLSGDIPTVQKTFFRNAISMIIARYFYVYYFWCLYISYDVRNSVFCNSISSRFFVFLFVVWCLMFFFRFCVFYAVNLVKFFCIKKHASLLRFARF